MKVLNLYAGIGGNRKLWPDHVEVTAVEIDQEIAQEYKKNFPNDNVVVADAKDYLLNNFQNFDFIWASPPCPTHSRMRLFWSGESNTTDKISGTSYKLPDMDLYSIIIFLKHFFKGVWVVENVISYYEPLIKPYICSNHYFWSNRHITNLKKSTRSIINGDKIKAINAKKENYDLELNTENFNLQMSNKILNNCVPPKVGLHVFNCCFKIKQEVLKIEVL